MNLSLSNTVIGFTKVKIVLENLTNLLFSPYFYSRYHKKQRMETIFFYLKQTISWTMFLASFQPFQFLFLKPLFFFWEQPWDSIFYFLLNYAHWTISVQMIKYTDRIYFVLRSTEPFGGWKTQGVENKFWNLDLDQKKGCQTGKGRIEYF